MATSIRDNTKPRKRPPGKGTLIGVRLQPDLLAWLDELRSHTKPEVSRPEMIRSILARIKG